MNGVIYFAMGMVILYLMLAIAWWLESGKVMALREEVRRLKEFLPKCDWHDYEHPQFRDELRKIK